MHAHTATMLSSKNTNLSTSPLIRWLPIALWIKPRFRKQSELCPHFLSRELLLPPCEHYAVFKDWDALTLCLCTLCSFCLPCHSPCLFSHCTFPAQRCHPKNSSFKFQSILSLLNGLPWLSLHYPGLRPDDKHSSHSSHFHSFSSHTKRKVLSALCSCLKKGIKSEMPHYFSFLPTQNL